MKILYININGEAIQSDDNIEVIGTKEDAIIDSFYISLGMAIANGVTGIKYKPLVADFAKSKPEEFKSFTKQWNEVKALLLGDNPSGDFEFVLTSEYLEWLKMNSSYSDIYYKKYQGQREAKVNLSLDELYEDIVDAIRRKVIRFLHATDNYKNYDEFVVNDERVTRRSLLVRSIKSKFEDIAFVLYEKWINENIDKRIEDSDHRYKKNGKEDNIGNQKTDWDPVFEIIDEILSRNQQIDWDALFPVYGVSLGKTNILDVGNPQRIEYNKGFKRCELYTDVYVVQREGDNYINSIYIIENTSTNTLPQKWASLLGISFGQSQEECHKILRSKGIEIRNIIHGKEGIALIIISRDDKYLIQIEFCDNRFDVISISLFKCPTCDSSDVVTSYDEYANVELVCKNCGNRWGTYYDNSEEDENEEKDEKKDEIISRFFEFYGIILGRTTRQEIIDMGGKKKDDYYRLPNGMVCHLSGDIVNFVTIYFECDLPYFYRDIGLSWNCTIANIKSILGEFGFVEEPAGTGFELKETIWCNKYQKKLRIILSTVPSGLFAIHFKC